MAVWDFIKNIAENLSDTLSDLGDSVSENSDTPIPSNKIPKFFSKSSSNANSVPNFPKIELIGTKGNRSKGVKNQLTISDFQKKYVIESLQKKIDSMSDQEKAYVYYYLAYRHNKLRCILGSKIDESEIAMNYIEKALELYPDNLDFVYEYFRICEWDDFCFCKDKIKDVCELCIKLSNNQDIKNEFCDIYYLMGQYYYREEELYSKAIDCLNKAIKYSKGKPQEEYLYLQKYLATLYDTVGDFKGALKICDYILSIKPDYYGVSEMRGKILNKIKAGITVTPIKRKSYDSDMFFLFKNCEGKYPLKRIQEAYDHYTNAQNLVQKGKRAEAIKEYQLIKKLLPEESQQLNDLISMHISIGLSYDEKGMDTDLLFECLFENLKIVSASGNLKELARLYNALGCAYSDIGDHDKSIEYHKKSLNVREDPYHYSNLAISYVSAGKYYEAIEIYEKIKKNYPGVEHINPDYQIERLKGIIAGKIDPKEKIDDNKVLADEHNKEGDLQFDKQNYVRALEHFNAAFGTKERVEYLFKLLLCRNIYESPYYEESEKGFEAVKLCTKEYDFKYLPFICTVYGDALSYEAWGQSKLSAEYYEIAVFLLDMVPVSERFAAPYYKLGRLKEEYENYKEALKLFEQTKEIDKNYSVEGDINRIKNILEGKEEANQKQFANHFEQMKKYQKANIHNMLIEEGKKALEYSPNNIDILFLIANTVDSVYLPYEQKWAAKEGLRFDLDKYDEKQLFYKFLLVLGKICKYENKMEQAKYYLKVIIENEDDSSRDYYQEAQTELYTLDQSW